MNRVVIFIAISMFLFGCAGAPKMNNLSLGMTKSEVINVMGPPDSVSAKGGTEYMKYDLWRDFWDRKPGDYSDPYFVRLIHDKVESYGKIGDFDSTKIPETKQIIDLNIKQ